MRAPARSGSHKLNIELAQLNYYRGVREIVTGTGASQQGSALAMASPLPGRAALSFMVQCSHEQQPLCATLMRLNGARVVVIPAS